MVELDVRHDRDLAGELEERAVGLVGLDHDPLPRSPGGVGPGAAQLAADRGRRGRGRSRAARARPCRGGGLAVRAGDRDRALQPESSPSRSARWRTAGRARARPPAPGCPPGSPSRRSPRRPRARLRRRGRPPARCRVAQPRAVRGLGPVRAGHIGAERARHQRQPTHAGAADPDEVEPRPVKGASLTAATIRVA